MEELTGAWMRGWVPPDDRAIYEWARENVDLPKKAYAIPGPFMVERSPYLRQVFDYFADDRVRHINVLKGVQTAGSLAGEICLDWVFANSPGPAMWVANVDDEAMEHYDTRIAQVIQCSLANKSLFARARRRRGLIQFPHMDLYINGANKSSLQRKSIRWLFADEPWLWAPGMMAEALGRCDGFPSSKKILMISQAGDWDGDWHTKHEEGKQYALTVRCQNPACGHRQPLEFFGYMLDEPDVRAGIVWNENARRSDDRWNIQEAAESASFRCRKCGHRHPDEPATWQALDRSMQHVDQEPEKGFEMVSLKWESTVRGYWGDLVKEYLNACEARDKGVVEWLKRFFQKKLVRFWKEELGTEKIVLRRSGYDKGTVPEDADFVFMTADYQEGRKNETEHYWFVVRAWFKDGSSKLIDEGRMPTHEELRKLQLDYGIKDPCVCVDGGDELLKIAGICALYGWTVLEGSALEMFWHKLKGKKKGQVQRPYSPRRRVDPRRGRVGARRSFAYSFLWSNPSVKNTLWRLRHGRGAKWEVARNVSPAYEDQIDSEVKLRIVNARTSAVSYIWKCYKDNRNHLWDCECEQVACAFIAGILVFNPEELTEEDPNAKEMPEPNLSIKQNSEVNQLEMSL